MEVVELVKLLLCIRAHIVVDIPTIAILIIVIIVLVIVVMSIQILLIPT